MRFSRAWPSMIFFAASVGCGGNVVVDGAAGTGGVTSTTTSSSIGASTTTGSSGTTTFTTGTGEGCPAIPPHEGDPCSSPGLACPMPLLCCGPTVTCSAGTWHVPPVACAQPCIPCGNDQGCAGDAVCVEEPSAGPPPPGGPRLDCKANPCAGQTLSCSCASSVCEGAGCQGVMGNWVLCTQGA